MAYMSFILLLLFSLSVAEVQPLFEQGKCQQVVAKLEPVWEGAPQWQTFGRELSICYLQDLRYEDAYRVLTKLRSKMPFAHFVDSVGKEYLQLLFRAKHFEEGERFLREVEKIGRFSLKLLEEALKIEEALGDYRQAVHWINLVEKQGMIPPVYIEKKGDYYRYLGKQEEAILSYLGVLSHSQVVSSALRAKLEQMPAEKVNALLKSTLRKQFSPALLRYAVSRAVNFSHFFQDIGLLLPLPLDEKLKAVVEVSRERGSKFYCDALSELNRVYGDRFPYRITFQEYRRCHPESSYQAFCRESQGDLEKGRCSILLGEKESAEKLLRKYLSEYPESESSLSALKLLFALEKESQSIAEALVWTQYGEFQKALNSLLEDGSSEALALAVRLYVQSGQPQKAVALYFAHSELSKREDAIYGAIEALKAMQDLKWKEIAALYLNLFPEGEFAWKVRKELENAP